MSRPKREQFVRVTIDGKEIWVPTRVDSWAAVLIALKIPPGRTVALRTEARPGDAVIPGSNSEAFVVLGERSLDQPGKNVRWWGFTEGEEYVSFREDEVPSASDAAELEAEADEDDPFGLGFEAWKGDGGDE